MDENWRARRFDENRAHLKSVAQRMLGSASEAEDAVQESWLKLSRSDSEAVQNLRGWLTTIVARVCLDMLRSRKSRREDALLAAAEPASASNLEDDVVLAEATGPALMVILETLTPGERVAFVLHDMFDLSFEEIARVVDRTPAATRQLASRARRRVRGAELPDPDPSRNHELVSAFLAASRDGDFESLLALLSPDVVMRADDLAVRTAAVRAQHGAPSLAPEIRGANQVADVFKGRARAALPALIDGEAGAVWMMGDEVRSAFIFTIVREKITAIDLMMSPEDLVELHVKTK